MPRSFRKTFLALSVIIAGFDCLLIWFNYQASEQALQQSLIKQGRQLHDSFVIELQHTATFMRQLATYVANDQRVAELFYLGADAVKREGGTAGGIEATFYRQQLFELVQNSWQHMTQNFQVRQLHFHLPPDISFLRVHEPEKFGDNLSALRHTVVTTNAQLKDTQGFESGRVYSGIRGVVPVFYTPPGSRQAVHVGALEAGTSLLPLLQQMHQVKDTHFAVLLADAHAKSAMWPKFYQHYQKQHAAVGGYLLESSTNADATLALLQNQKIVDLLQQHGTTRVKLGGQQVAVTALSLRDYRGTQDAARADVGTVLVWVSAEDAVFAFEQSLLINIAIAIVGFLIVEILLLWTLRREGDLRSSQKLAMLDGLTGIANRRAFDECLIAETERAQRRGDWLSVIVCDVDYFKQFNDHYGHQQGDAALQAVAEALKETFSRAGDHVARYGGEEFVIVLPQTKAAGAITMAELLCQAVRDLEIEHHKSSLSDNLTISCGVASVHLSRYSSSISADKLLKAADQALYVAKQTGRNRVSVSPIEAV